MTHSPRFTRRRVIGGAAAGAGTLALAGCAPDRFVTGDVNVAQVANLPDDADDHRWLRSPRLAVELGPQDMALPLRLEPAVRALSVRALHDRERIAFLLEWDDADADDLTIEVDRFRDACAVLLAPGPPAAELRPMGTATQPVTLLHWKADWQRDVDEGRQGLDAAYPNRTIDVYPPLYQTAPAEVGPDTYESSDAMQWLPGMDVGNPISVAGRSSPVEKLIAFGFGTSTHTAQQAATGRGVRGATGWRVIITRPLTATDEGEVDLDPGTVATAAFAVWSGGDREVGSRKAPSTKVYAMFLER